MRWVSLLVAVAWLSGCGGDSENDGTAAGGTGAAVGASGSSPGAGAGGKSAGTGGTAASAGSPGGVAGARSVDCSGTFGAPTSVLSPLDTELGSLAPSADELELIYTSGPTTGPYGGRFFRSVRASKESPFEPGTQLSELDAACLDPVHARSGDLTSDGLRFYFGCYNLDEPDPKLELRLARRAAPGAPFVVDATTYGTIRPGMSISLDELSLYTSPNYQENMATNVYVRSSVSAPFGSVAILAGLEGVITPDISSDDRFLFGTAATSPSTIVMAERSAATNPFSSHTTLLTSPEARTSFGSTAISHDCRSLYYVSVDSNSALNYRVMVMKR